MTVIQSEKISKIYRQGWRGKNVALQEVDLQVKAGEVFGILGANGAGKTTLVKILLGLIRPTSGKSDILGSKGRWSNAWKKKVGYLAENHRYPLYLTGYQVLQHFGWLSGVSGKTLEKRIAQTLALVGMEKWRDVKVRKYSKGMMQRIGIAQAIINDPEVVFLDEPTDGVDPIGRKEIRDVLLHLRKQGKTIFLNSHLLSEVEKICDRIAILKEGKIVHEGSVAELGKEPHAFFFEVKNLPQQCWSKLQELAESLTSCQGGFYVTPRDKGLDKIIDYLRENNVSICQIVSQKTSLEDFFIEKVQDFSDKEK